MKAAKVELVKMSDMVLINGTNELDLTWNHRDASEAGYDLAPLIKEIEENSWQKETKTLKSLPVLLKTEQGFRILQGHRRVSAIKALGWEDFRAFVYDAKEVSDIQRMELILDIGNSKRIQKHEAFTAICHCFDAAMTEEQVVTTVQGLLTDLFPRTPSELATLKTPTDWLASYKGTIQGFKRPWQCPYVVKDAYYAKLQGTQTWPSDREVSECLKVFTDECQANPGMFSKAKPGPKFLEKWADVVKTREAAAAEGAGGRRVKTSSMLTRTQIEEIERGTESPILRLAFLRALNKIPADMFKKLQDIQLRLEKECLTDQEKDDILFILKSAVPVSNAAETAPVSNAAETAPEKKA